MKELTDETILHKSKSGSLRKRFLVLFKPRKYKRKVEYTKFLNSDINLMLTPPHLLALFELQSCFGYGNYFQSKSTNCLNVDELQRLLEKDDFYYWD